MSTQLSRAAAAFVLAVGVGNACEGTPGVVEPHPGAHEPATSLNVFAAAGSNPAGDRSWSTLAGRHIAPNNDDDLPSVAGDVALTASSGKAAGHAAIHGTLLQNIEDERYSFTATSTDYPAGRGEAEVHLLTFDGHLVDVHAEITCISVVGSQAWIGSLVRLFEEDGQPVPFPAGLKMTFRVQDAGEGVVATDMASLVFFPTQPDRDLTFCTTRPTGNALRPSESGNIQVTGSE